MMDLRKSLGGGQPENSYYHVCSDQADFENDCHRYKQTAFEEISQSRVPAVDLFSSGTI